MKGVEYKISPEENSRLLVAGIEHSLSAEWFRENWSKDIYESLFLFLNWLFSYWGKILKGKKGIIWLIVLRKDRPIGFETHGLEPGDGTAPVCVYFTKPSRICCLFQLKDWTSDFLLSMLQKIFEKQEPTHENLP
jgi:hypothetical protein